MVGQRRERDSECFFKILLILPGLKFSLTHGNCLLRNRMFNLEILKFNFCLID